MHDDVTRLLAGRIPTALSSSGLSMFGRGGVDGLRRRGRAPDPESEEGMPPMRLCEVIVAQPALVGELLRAGADPRTVREGTVHVCANCPGGMCPGPLHRCWQALSGEARPDGDVVPQLVRAFNALVRAGASVDTPDSTGASVASLVEAAAAAQEPKPDEIPGELLESIERLRAAATDAGNQLLAAAEQGDHAQLSALLWERRARHGFGFEPEFGDEPTTSRADANFQDGAGLSALHWALVRGHADAATVLLRNGADLQLQDSWGLRCVHAPFAAGAAAAAATQENGADDRGTHPLAHEPAPEPSRLHSVLEVLIETAKIDVNQMDTFGGGTLLHYAVHHGEIETVRGLRWNGARSDVKDAQGKTAVERAGKDPAMQQALAEVPPVALPVESADGLSEIQCVPFPRVSRVQEQKATEPIGDAAVSKQSRASAASALFGNASPKAAFGRSARSFDSGSEDNASDGGSDGGGSDLFDGLDEVIMMPWEDLSVEQQEAAKVLGWRGETQWADEANVNVRAVDKSFQQLSSTEQAACEVLEISEDDWDDMQVGRPMLSEPEPELDPGLEPAQAVAFEQRESLDQSHTARLLSSDALSAYRAHAISEISSLLNSNQHVAISLLSRHSWDVGTCFTTISLCASTLCGRYFSWCLCAVPVA